MKLKDLILKSLNHQDVVEKIAEAIRDDLINNQRLSKKEISRLDNDLEVAELKNGSRTLLSDYLNLESAIEEVIENEIVPKFEKKHSKVNDFVR